MTKIMTKITERKLLSQRMIISQSSKRSLSFRMRDVLIAGCAWGIWLFVAWQVLVLK